MLIKVKSYFLFFILIVLGGCSLESTCIDSPVLENKVDVKIDRLEFSFFKLKSIHEIISFLSAHPVLADEFLGRKQYPSDSLLALTLYKRLRNNYVDTLYNETITYFEDLSALELEFEKSFNYLKYYYPDFKIPQIKTMITGFGSNEIYVGENQIIIGLEYYLGKNAKYKPPRVPNYILPRYDKSYIVPAVMLLYADKYLAENTNDRTMLADMIYYGKKYYFTKQMMPCVNDSLLIWYSGEELNDVKQNKDIIWLHFMNNKLLYETSHTIKQKYMDERPKIFEIGEKCPGRIGSWLGWDIVKVYMKNNPKVSLQELMKNPNAKEILIKSSYKIY